MQLFELVSIKHFMVLIDYLILGMEEFLIMIQMLSVI